MILSAYEKRGEAKLFSDEDQIRAFYRRPLQTYSTSRSVTPQSPVTIMQPNTNSEYELDERVIRYGLRGIKKGLRKIVPRFVPYIGWAITAKDIYDFVTD
jgi:hypothetical protein